MLRETTSRGWDPWCTYVHVPSREYISLESLLFLHADTRETLEKHLQTTQSLAPTSTRNVRQRRTRRRESKGVALTSRHLLLEKKHTCPAISSSSLSSNAVERKLKLSIFFPSYTRTSSALPTFLRPLPDTQIVLLRIITEA